MPHQPVAARHDELKLVAADSLRSTPDAAAFVAAFVDATRHVSAVRP
jgi:hypothetical protein